MCQLLKSSLSRINWIWAIDKFCVEQLISCQKCRANDCLAIEFRAVHPHSYLFMLFFFCLHTRNIKHCNNLSYPNTPTYPHYLMDISVDHDIGTCIVGMSMDYFLTSFTKLHFLSSNSFFHKAILLWHNNQKLEQIWILF